MEDIVILQIFIQAYSECGWVIVKGYCPCIIPYFGEDMEWASLKEGKIGWWYMVASSVSKFIGSVSLRIQLPGGRKGGRSILVVDGMKEGKLGFVNDFVVRQYFQG